MWLNTLLWNIGYSICHQLPERTLTIGGLLLPMCARDTGIYLGFLAGLFFIIFKRKQSNHTFPPPNVAIAVLLMALPMTVDALLSYSRILPSTNTSRLLTGVFFGGALSIFLIPLFNYNRSLSKNPFVFDQSGPLANFTDLGLLITLEAGLFLIIYNLQGQMGGPHLNLLIAFLLICGLVLVFFLAFSILAFSMLGDKRKHWLPLAISMVCAFFIIMHSIHTYLGAALGV